MTKEKKRKKKKERQKPNKCSRHRVTCQPSRDIHSTADSHVSSRQHSQIRFIETPYDKHPRTRGNYGSGEAKEESKEIEKKRKKKKTMRDPDAAKMLYPRIPITRVPRYPKRGKGNMRGDRRSSTPPNAILAKPVTRNVGLPNDGKSKTRTIFERPIWRSGLEKNNGPWLFVCCVFDMAETSEKVSADAGRGGLTRLKRA